MAQTLEGRKIQGGALLPVVPVNPTGRQLFGVAAHLFVGGSAVTEGNPLPVQETSSFFRSSVQPTITAGAYTAEDTLGSRMEFTNVAGAGGSGWITKVIIASLVLQHSPIDLWLFSGAFTPAVDNNPFAITDVNLRTICLGHISIDTSNYSSAANNEVATKTSGMEMPFPFTLSPGVSSLFGQMKIRRGDTYGSTLDLTVILEGYTL